MQVTIAVRQFPPRVSFSSRVSLLYRKGTWLLFPYANIWMQFPRVRRDLLIFAPSIWREFFPPTALSDPARSTRLSLPMLTSYFIPRAFYLVSALTVRRAWDRDEASFDPVASLDRFAAPTFSRVTNSTREDIWISVAPWAYTPYLGSSRS